MGLPTAPPPLHGYRVLYVLDGYDYFASAVEAVRANLNAPDVVVVGIGYPDDPAFVDGVVARHQPLAPWFKGMAKEEAAYALERVYDLTLPATDHVLAAEAAPGAPSPRASDVGGLDDFLKTIEREVKPRVDALVPVNRSDQGLFGHSLGGLAVLHALFTEPGAFRTFVAASPSIWWAERKVLRDEPGFGRAVEHGQASPRVLLTVGAEEETVASGSETFGIDLAKLRAMVASQRMIGNARDLTLRLRRLHGAEGYDVADLAVFDRLGHGLSPWPALARGIAFAFPGE